MRRYGLIFGVLGCGVAGVFAQQPSTPSIPTNQSPTPAYHTRALGDPRSEAGATLHISAVEKDVRPFGSVSQTTDAAAFRGHQITFSALVSVRDAAQGAKLWLRADGANHARQSLAIGNSPILISQMPADATANTQYRQVSIDVPNEATQLVSGLILEGTGEATASQARLTLGQQVTEVSPQRLLNQAVEIVRTHALHRSDVDWPTVEPQIGAMAANAVVAKDVYPAIRALLKTLNDHHSFFIPPDRAARERNSVTISAEPTVELRAGQFGYVNVPGYEGGDVLARDAFATRMVNAIGGVAAQVRCGWIVDLRQNTGGSMIPMLGGLRPLLGDILGIGFRYAGGKVSWPVVGDGLSASVPHGLDLSRVPVAVLTGPRTASSGEVVAIAFRGRNATRSFGSATYGLSTGNSTYPLADGSILVLTTSVDLDRTGRVYGGKLEPDQPVMASSDAATDPVMDVAETWLASAPSCHH